jgi:hypothetical protein
MALCTQLAKAVAMNAMSLSAVNGEEITVISSAVVWARASFSGGGGGGGGASMGP